MQGQSIRALLLEISTPMPNASDDLPQLAGASLLHKNQTITSATYSFKGSTTAQMLSTIPWRSLPFLCQTISLLLIFIMGYKTFDYIMKRRAGKVGPAMAHILLKFWAVYGALQFFSPILALYLSPFKAQSLISCIRAPIILLLCYGHRLPMSTSIYSQYLVPIYDSHIAEIEQRLRSAREFKLKLDTELRQLAVYLLEKMAAGELSSLISIPAFEAPQGGIDAASQLSKQKEDTLGPPQNTAVFANRKEFFGEKVGQSSGRVLEIGAQNLDGAIQPVQISEFPKAAYNDLRALRKQFRERVQKRKNVKITPD